ncbi:MAG: helix-turn-helix domain-containing protein [Chitinophagales bacterium]|nr:helix-turn-helix domain-containing protein [Chitinophagales bacterium]
MNLSVGDIFVLISLGQGVFISLSILSSSFFRSKANTYLSISILLLTIITFFGWLNPEEFTLLDYIRCIMWEFLFPATFFHYILHALDHRFLKAKWIYWIYTPFIITFIVDTFFALSHYFHVYELPISPESYGMRVYFELEDDLSFIYNVFFVTWGFLLIKKDHSQYTEKIKWLRSLTFFLFFLLFSWFVLDALEETDIADYYEVMWLSLSILFWWVCYYGIYRLKILEQRSQLRSSNKKATIQKSEVEGQNKYLLQLEKLLAEEELYKNPLLSRMIIAERLGLSEGHFSKLINANLGKSFTQYINEYRIKEAIALLANPAFHTFSIVAIGEEVGFNSKSTFYKSFKEVTGRTPGEFKKQQIQS